MQGFIILAIIGTEKLIAIGVGRTDRNLNSYIAPCYKQVEERFLFIYYKFIVHL